MSQPVCPECGAVWSDGQTCTDQFHLMLLWELDQQMYDVHHLLVLCYHLQHPSLYSPEGLAGALRMLVDFVEHGVSPAQMRQQMKAAVDSGTRSYKIAGTPEAHGGYAHPVAWTMTAADVTQRGVEAYYEGVRAWAASVLESLRASGNLETL